MENLPQHLAIIPDGNRRWAKKKGLLPWLGHKSGVSNFKDLTDIIFKKGIRYLTFWALSIDNLHKRPKAELNFLFGYLKSELSKPETIADFVKNGVRVRVIGRWRELIKDSELIRTLNELESKTKKGTKYNLTILFVYDGTAEMVEAIGSLQGKRKLDYDAVKNVLWTGFLPEVSLVIRTGGEPHWSGGFMMWLTRDSQFYFTEKKWPEFDERELKAALSDYANRTRRLGK